MCCDLSTALNTGFIVEGVALHSRVLGQYAFCDVAHGENLPTSTFTTAHVILTDPAQNASS